MTARAGRGFVIALAAVVIVAGAPALFRPGYSPDEEFTVFAVRGIRAHGLPLLPSGLLYDRGLLYSYVSWLAGAATGLELPAFRGVSLLCSASVSSLLYALVRRVASPAAGVVAAMLVGMSLPFWAVATTGRFYAPFLLTCLGILVLLARGPRPELRWASPVGTWLPLAGLALLSRLTHELAFTLLAIPVAALTASSVAHRRPWIGVSAALAAGLIAGQVVLTALHFVVPGSGGSTMIQRFFLWQVLNLFERPSGAPLGVVLAGLIVAWLIVPARAAFSLVVGTSAALAVLAIALVRAAAMNPAVLVPRQIVAEGLAYPLDMFWHLAGAHPTMIWMALALLVARLCGAGGRWPAGERAAHLGWVGWALWFGVIDSGITINYVLLPTVCLLAAIGIDLVAIGQHAAALWPGRRGQMTRAALTGAALLVIADQWTGTGTLQHRLATARPTIEVAGIEEVRQTLRPGDRVACTDELACLLLVGRVDAWLALDDYVRDRFVVSQASQRVGVYAGAPAAFGLRDLFAPDAAGGAPARLIVIDVFKDYPIGNSRSWLPRALDADHLQARSLLSTRQARVVEVLEQ